VLSPEDAAVVRRAEILETARLHDYAVAELRTVLAGASAAEQRTLLPALVRMGAYAQAIQTALGLFRRGEMREEQLYDYLYPHAYADIVDREARSRGIDPYLVYSLIRQESLFDRRAVSASDACGLMQLLPSTARRVAGDDVELSGVMREDLFEPATNIRLGVAYLAELAARFDKNEVLMLAGYNAGEQAAERWRARFADLATDEFIEQISYRETRDYVKKVLRNYRNYRRLYGRGRDALAEARE
jgi:soluble lytic murein transglycosylase